MPPPDKQNTPGILYRNTNTTGKKIKSKYYNDVSTCTEDVQNIYLYRSSGLQ